MTKEDIVVGRKVKTLIELASIPRGCEGYIIKHYQGGALIGWDLPDQPWKPVLPIEEYEIERMPAIDPRCPLRDGFAYDELDLLAIVVDK